MDLPLLDRGAYCSEFSIQQDTQHLEFAFERHIVAEQLLKFIAAFPHRFHAGLVRLEIELISREGISARRRFRVENSYRDTIQLIQDLVSLVHSVKTGNRMRGAPPPNPAQDQQQHQ